MGVGEKLGSEEGREDPDEGWVLGWLLDDGCKLGAGGGCRFTTIDRAMSLQASLAPLPVVVRIPVVPVESKRFP